MVTLERIDAELRRENEALYRRLGYEGRKRVEADIGRDGKRESGSAHQNPSDKTTRTDQESGRGER